EDLASIGGLPVVIGANKIDLVGAAPAISETPAEIETIYLSCKTGEGIDNLVGHLVAHINEGMPDFTSGMIVTSARHRQKLETAETALRSASEKISLKESPELVAFDLRQAAGALEEITGRIYNEDILDQIFSKFCIGK
ncbi:MAG TPA: tRNA uridine-5-carboxymethylaminomethyl(34) synthesis GTPase MnmE, partial [candidate division Zixibacteria bacterium]|nr:tRNA uridine-5-carboxymethylaminomethyl(34) synthesis GTPase MnmE [candidate division Zixibacteria bacterium]